jgi:hypothetical protein
MGMGPLLHYPQSSLYKLDVGGDCVIDIGDPDPLAL